MSQRRSPEPVANPARGVALVVVAVLVGLFLLRNGLDTSEVVSGDDTPAATAGVTDGSTAGSTDAGTTEGTDEVSSTTIALRQPAEVPTIVLNGSGASGAAKRYSTYLASLGYALTNAEGANATNNVQTTQVFYAEGFEQEAVVVANALGSVGGIAAPQVAVQPTASLGVTNGASVVVVLGPDLGSVNPPATN